MPRLPRLNLPGIPQHIVQRGNNRQDCFFEEQDYIVYLDKLKEYSIKNNVAVHSYVLMTNHVHLLVTPTQGDGVSKMMQSLGRCYVRYINQTYERTGSIWEGRFKSSLVDSENYLLRVSCYIEMNPARANMVAELSDYPWSSYQHNALGKDIKLITPHECYQSLAKTDKTRQKRYRALFDQQLTEDQLQAIRDSINKAWVLGEDRFKKRIAKKAGRRVIPQQRGGDRKSEAYRASRANH